MIVLGQPLVRSQHDALEVPDIVLNRTKKLEGPGIVQVESIPCNPKINLVAQDFQPVSKRPGPRWLRVRPNTTIVKRDLAAILLQQTIQLDDICILGKQ